MFSIVLDRANNFLGHLCSEIVAIKKYIDSSILTETREVSEKTFVVDGLSMEDYAEV
jgi:hypothetical protein